MKQQPLPGIPVLSRCTVPPCCRRALDQGEAQPAAFVLARKLRIDLDEGLEEPCLVGGGDAGASVLHGKVDEPPPGSSTTLRVT